MRQVPQRPLLSKLTQSIPFPNGRTCWFHPLPSWSRGVLINQFPTLQAQCLPAFFSTHESSRVVKSPQESSRASYIYCRTCGCLSHLFNTMAWKANISRTSYGVDHLTDETLGMAEFFPLYSNPSEAGPPNPIEPHQTGEAPHRSRWHKNGRMFVVASLPVSSSRHDALPLTLSIRRPAWLSPCRKQ